MVVAFRPFDYTAVVAKTVADADGGDDADVNEGVLCLTLQIPLHLSLMLANNEPVAAAAVVVAVAVKGLADKTHFQKMEIGLKWVRHKGCLWKQG